MGLRYSMKKIFYFKDKINSLSKSTDKIMPPIHIRIKPTNVCNHNCSYCAYRSDNLQLGKDMQGRDFIPREKMLEIIDNAGCMKVGAITFSGGGDPFCYPYLLESIKKISKTPIKFAALTNGSRLTGELAEIFAHCGTWLRISIDGWDDESYSHYRGVPKNEFSKIMQNIRDFKKLGGKCSLGLSIVLDKENVVHIYNFIQSLKNIGVDSIKVSPCITSNNIKDNNKYHEPFYEKTKESIKKAIADFEDQDFEIFDAYHRLDEEFDKEYTWCPYQQILPIIGADLNVYTCQDKAYNLDKGILGSIKDKSFKEFWFQSKDKFFEINPSAHCNHRCVADKKNRAILEYLKLDKDHLSFV